MIQQEQDLLELRLNSSDKVDKVEKGQETVKVNMRLKTKMMETNLTKTL